MAYSETESNACLYTATNSITLGGVSGSSLTIKPGVDVKIVSPHIIFKPGVKLEKGAKLSAKPGAALNGSQKSASASILQPAITYLTPSPFNSKVYDYSGDEIPTSIIERNANATIASVYPNPITGSLTIELIGQWTGKTEVSIRNVLGQPFNSIVFHSEGLQLINMEHAPSGIYFVSIINGSSSYIQKIIKK